MTWTCSARRRRELGHSGTDNSRNDPLHSCLQEADEEKAIAKRQKAIAEDGRSMESQVGLSR